MSDPNTFDPDAVIVDLQTQIKARLVSDDWFSGIDIFTPDDVDASGKPQAMADIAQRVAQSLASNKGLCIIVAVPDLVDFQPDSPGIYADQVSVIVRIIEVPTVNRTPIGTFKTVSMVGIRTTRRMHHFTYMDNALTIKRSGIIPTDPEEGKLVWDVVLRTRLELPALTVTSPVIP